MEDTDWRDIREDLGAPYVSKHFITDVLQKFELDATVGTQQGRRDGPPSNFVMTPAREMQLPTE